MKYIRDLADVHKIAHAQRLNQYRNFVPGFAQKLKEDAKGTLKKYCLDLNEDDIHFTKGTDGQVIATNPDGAMAKYIEFCNAKLAHVDELKTRADSDFASAAYAKWRKRQVVRGFYQFDPGSAKSIVHSVLTFELSQGCSVGCKFCGLNAGELRGIFRYSEENAKLWQEVLEICHRVLGSCADEAICYYATEPLDNPDYERFIADFRRELKHTPQITTAAALRNIERTRKIFAELSLEEDTIHRISVHSLEDFYTIMDAFTPEELILVELLPQYEQAPACALSSVGRNHVEGESYGTTIACVSGFLVNMFSKTIRLMTPTNPSERYPNGQVCLAERSFTDAESFEKALCDIISGLKTILSPKERLMLYPWLSLDESKGNPRIENKMGTELEILSPEVYTVVKLVFPLLQQGKYTRSEIVDIIKQQIPETDKTMMFYLISTWWNSGIIWDSQLFGDIQNVL